MSEFADGERPNPPGDQEVPQVQGRQRVGLPCGHLMLPLKTRAVSLYQGDFE